MLLRARGRGCEEREWEQTTIKEETEEEGNFSTAKEHHMSHEGKSSVWSVIFSETGRRGARETESGGGGVLEEEGRGPRGGGREMRKGSR